MIKLEIFNKETKKKELYERGDTSVIELEDYWKMQEKIREYINTSDDPKKTMILEMQLKFIVKLFNDKDLSVDFLKKIFLPKIKRYFGVCLSRNFTRRV